MSQQSDPKKKRNSSPLWIQRRWDDNILIRGCLDVQNVCVLARGLNYLKWIAPLEMNEGHLTQQVWTDSSVTTQSIASYP